MNHVEEGEDRCRGSQKVTNTSEGLCVLLYVSCYMPMSSDRLPGGPQVSQQHPRVPRHCMSQGLCLRALGTTNPGSEAIPAHSTREDLQLEDAQNA